MWNSLDLKCPIEDFVEYPPQEQCFAEDLQDFVTVLSTAANTLTSENPLWTELDILGNIQKKYKRLLRCDKCLVYLQRVGHCTKKMVLLNLSKSYLDLAERFLVGFQNSLLTHRLPSRQQLEYVLIRTLTAAKLICDGIKYSRDTFCYLIQKLKVGHLILDLVMAASVIARLNVLLKATSEQLCSLYQQLLSWKYKLKKGTYVWERKPDLPQNLKEWLKSFEPDPLPISQADVNTLTQLLKGNNTSQESDSESVVVVREVEPEDSVNAAQTVDYGEVVPRQKAKKSPELTPLQKSLLQKIVQTQSLRNLEELWENIVNFPANHFPIALSKEKRKVISNLFARIKSNVPENKFNKTFRNGSQILKSVHTVFCKHLGFTKKDVEWANSDSGSLLEESEIELVPVKTLKDLKDLYDRLCEILISRKNFKKHRKLEKFFKKRSSDIKLLKQNGEKVTAKKLVFCTSKLLLTLYQK